MMRRGGIAIRAEGVSKLYRIGAPARAYRTLREALVDAAAAPFERLRGRARAAEADTRFWALRDVSFEIAEGEIVGVVGRNGAGKSTLLKILSRITDPTEGRATLEGRVASLLEVGTGFHPELTGRENIFLNGAILGMRRADIAKRFDAIVDFAEIERFIDTPVKHYSSGMYVRLAFAVAAHLEPDILVVDEVLAVGDARFQQKCLGKIDEVSRKGGRTVLLVSHNLAAVKSLATSGLVFDRGRLVLQGSVDDAIAAYGRLQQDGGADEAEHDWGAGAHTRIRSVEMIGDDGPTRVYLPGTPLRLRIILDTDGTPGLSVDVFLANAQRARIALWSLSHFDAMSLPAEPGCYELTIEAAPIHLASGQYCIDVATAVTMVNWDHQVYEALAFETPFSNVGGGSWDFKQSFGFGFVALPSTTPPKLARLDERRA
ncbi:lipopolysaccharide transport system ATP-binding protein [Methylosinus sp. sav-2]|uniref:ABC transporter ATP-binding protein n=1 Tax=Methylosinus sp. sav-2 TaxID=2485168 RepID=UPI00068DDD43|nr:polysaccharide ABC transporter ATP-binding protein [Methylosinus sp. sav-2]TDX63943.1 lipopolysaccharide transport system ATP-binding protein [Methylosinus sp. sav-2]